MILACHNIEKAFGEEVIVSGGSFHIEDHEKAALVGPNGAGKTTLLKMIVGEIQADGGNVVLTRGKTMGYLAQHQDMNNDHTIYQEVRTAKADILDMERQIREIEQEMKHLSGERLEERMNTYQRLTAAFERENGRIRKTGRDFIRRSENPCLSRKTAPHKAGYSAFGRANQPFGFKFHLMAGNLSSELSRCSTDCLS